MNPLRTLHVERNVLRRPIEKAALGALIALISACHDGHGTHVHTIPPPPPPPPVFWEGEPNDTAWLAPWFGGLFVGESAYVAGHTTDDGSDPQDGLAFTAFGPLRIDFTLWVDDPWTDLDIWLYDPQTGFFLHAFDAPYGDESGTFWVDDARDFHLVVVSSDGASTWTLGVWASGHSSAGAMQAPGDAMQATGGVMSAIGSTPESGLPPLPASLEAYADPHSILESHGPKRPFDPEDPAVPEENPLLPR